MNWWPIFWLVIYAVAGVFLSLWICEQEKGYLTPNDWLMSILFGWFVGVPAFVLLLICFGNWPVIVRDTWAFICWPLTVYRRWRAPPQDSPPSEA